MSTYISSVAFLAHFFSYENFTVVTSFKTDKKEGILIILGILSITV